MSENNAKIGLGVGANLPPGLMLSEFAMKGLGPL